MSGPVPFWLAAVVVLALFVSAISVVAVKQRSRVLQAELQALKVEHEALDVEFDQLRLERGAVGAYARIEQQALEQLNMHAPSEYKIVQLPANR